MCPGCYVTGLDHIIRRALAQTNRNGKEFECQRFNANGGERSPMRTQSHGKKPFAIVFWMGKNLAFWFSLNTLR